MNYPEHEKLQAVKEESQVQGNFLEWLDGRGLVICKWHDEAGHYVPLTKRIEELLAEYHEIDLRKIEDEKRAMIAEMRKNERGSLKSSLTLADVLR